MTNPAPQQDQTRTTVYVLNGTSTSAGNGPGYASLPVAEASWLIGQSLAVAGSDPPPNSEGTHGPVTPR
jgi:hypothetical protein